MNTKLALGIRQAQKLSDRRQEELGQFLLDVAEQEMSDVCLSDDQLAEVKRRMESPTSLVPEAEMKAFFDRLG